MSRSIREDIPTLSLEPGPALRRTDWPWRILSYLPCTETKAKLLLGVMPESEQEFDAAVKHLESLGVATRTAGTIRRKR